MEFKEKTPRSSWKSIFSFLKNLISSMYFWFFTQNVWEKSQTDQTNSSRQGDVTCTISFHTLSNTQPLLSVRFK